MALKTAEAVVIGGGIAGTSVAHWLLKKGLRQVVLLERESIASEATGKTNALVRCHYANPHDAALAFKSLEMFTHWREIFGGESGFKATGFLCVVGPHDVEKLKANVRMLQRVGVNTRVLGPEELLELQPFLSLERVGAAAYEPESGHADGYLAATSIARRVQELGGSVRQGVAVTRIQAAQDRVVGVETTEGVIQTPRVVLCAGAWCAQLARTAGVELPLGVLRASTGVLERPPDFKDPVMTYVDRIIGQSIRIDTGPHLRTGMYGLVREPYQVADPDHYDREVDFQWKAYSAMRLAQRIPAMLNGRWRSTWSGVDGLSPDGHAVLGPVPSVEGLYLMGGFSGTGFKISPAAGLCMAELILEGQPKTADIHAFRLSRFQEKDPIVEPNEYTVPPFHPSREQ